MTDATRRTIEAVFRIEQAKVIAGVARVVRDIGLAEDLAQDALAIALERWPTDGEPDNPAAWLMATAKHRAVDTLRRAAMADRKHAALAEELSQRAEPDPDDAAMDDIGDDLLRLIFTACHPALPRESRIALTLRVLGGMTTAEIARAFLAREAAVAQRIVRAKRTLAEEDVAFELPSAAEREARLSSVLEVLYAIFNEGYAATAGADLTRPDLCFEAVRLARVLQGLLPGEPEVQGLAALMELQASRLRARTGPGGSPVLLLDQDRSRWDRVFITRGLVALARAEDAGPLGPYGVQAAIAACHARARTADETDWEQIASLYAVLAAISPSPVVELNRAVAVGMARGPQAGLDLLDVLRDEPALREYHLLFGARADLLERLGRAGEAREEFTHAAGLARNERERDLLLSRAAALA